MWPALQLVVLLAADLPTPPPTRIDAVVDRMHGVDVPDPYRWLEDQQSAETRDWIARQNAYTRSVLDTVPGRAEIRSQLEAVRRFHYITSPRSRNGRYFYLRRGIDQEQGQLNVRFGLTGAERILLDPKTVSGDVAVSLSILDVRADGQVVAFLQRKGGQDEAEMCFLDVDSGELRQDRLPSGDYFGAFLTPDKRSVIYSQRRPGSSMLLKEHVFGTPPLQDRLLFQPDGPPNQVLFLQASEDGRFVAAFVNEGPKSRIFSLDRQSKESKFQPLLTGISARSDGQFGGHTLFIRTTWDAPNGRVMAIDMEHAQRENWRQVIPQSTDAVMTNLVPSGHKLLVSYLRNVSSRLAIFNPDGSFVRDIQLPTLGSGYLMGGGSWNSSEVFYRFNSFSYPVTTYRYDLSTGKTSLWHKDKIPVDSDSISTKQVWFPSKDGTRVPMFVVSKNNIPLDGTRPLLLSGYGGYGAIETPNFWPMIAVWVQRGGIYALANIRGGGELGEKWHRDGKLDKKQNSFDDFTSAAQWLIANKYTSPAKLAIDGTSNGGMLVAVAAMQRPDLFRAVISRNAHLDMLRYHKFFKAATWTPEFGNPDIAAEFQYLSQYSPYHHVRDNVHYPAMLFTTGDNDTRVAPLHARKMVARLQATRPFGNPFLLLYDAISGHSGGLSVSREVERETDELLFLDSQLSSH